MHLVGGFTSLFFKGLEEGFKVAEGEFASGSPRENFHASSFARLCILKEGYFEAPSCSVISYSFYSVLAWGFLLQLFLQALDL